MVNRVMNLGNSKEYKEPKTEKKVAKKTTEGDK